MAEEVQTEKTQNDKNKISGKTKAVVAILALCMVAVIVAASWNHIAPEKLLGNLEAGMLSNGKGGNYPVGIVGTSVDNGNFSMLMDNISYVSDTSFVAINDTAKEVFNRQLSYTAPIHINNGEYSLIYNLGGKGYQVDTTRETALKEQTEDNIITADITQKGVLAIVTEDKGYLSKLTVYNADNSQKYSYSFSEYYVTGVSVNEDGNSAVVIGASTENGTITSAVYVLDFKKQEPTAVLKFTDNLIYRVKFFDNGSIGCIGEDALEIISSNYTDFKEYSYNGSMLTQFKIDTGSGVALSLSRSADGRSCDLVYINKYGDVVSETSTGMKISGMDVYGDKIAVLSYGSVYVFSRSGKKYDVELSAGVDAKAIVLASESKAYLLAVSEIRVIDL